MDGIFIVEISIPIKYQGWCGQFLIFYQILNALFQKKTQTGKGGGGFEVKEQKEVKFPGVLNKN